MDGWCMMYSFRRDRCPQNVLYYAHLRSLWRLQALGCFVWPGQLAAKLHESHLLSPASALPLPHHLCLAGNAAVWRQIQLWRNSDEEEYFWLVPSGSAHLFPGDSLISDLKTCRPTDFICLTDNNQIMTTQKNKILLTAPAGPPTGITGPLKSELLLCSVSIKLGHKTPFLHRQMRNI